MFKLGILFTSIALIGGASALSDEIGGEVTEVVTDHVETSEFDENTEISSEVTTDEPVVTEPVVTEPVVTEPVTEEPVTEEPVTEEPVTEEPEVFESFLSSSVYWITEETTVEDSKHIYGDILLSKESGHVGDEVVAIVSGNPTMDISGKTVAMYKYALSYVTVNGEKISPYDMEKGEYHITLVEGMNDVRAYFSGRVELSILDITSVNWKNLLTVDNLLKLIYFALTLFLSSGFFITLIKSRQQRAKTTDEITNIVNTSVKEVTSTNVKNFLIETVKPLLDKQSEQLSDSAETSRVLMRVALLAQENTPESRLAITKELQNYKTSDKDLAAQIQTIVENSIKKAEEEKKAKEEAIQEAKKSVESLGVDEGEVEREEVDEYGKL